MKPVPKIGIMGISFDTTNNGVKALSSAVISLIYKNIDNPDINIYTPSRSLKKVDFNYLGSVKTINVLNYRLSPKAKIKEHLLFLFFTTLLWWIIPVKWVRSLIEKHNVWIKETVHTDMILDVFAGDSFSDIYGLHSYLLHFIERLIVILTGKRIVFLPQTYGPFHSKFSRILARFLLKHSAAVYSRDIKGLSVVKRLVNNDKISPSFCPDIAFTLGMEKPDIIVIEPDLFEFPDTEFIGINISGLLTRGGPRFGFTLDYDMLMLQTTEYFLNNTDSFIFFIPHTFGISNLADPNQDYCACRKLFDNLRNNYPDRLLLLNSFYSHEQIKYFISKCIFFVGGRMHACIGALSMNVPACGIGYSRKFKGVYQSVNTYDLVIDPCSLNTNDAFQKIIKLYHNKTNFRNILQESIPEVKNRIYDSFDKLFKSSLNNF